MHTHTDCLFKSLDLCLNEDVKAVVCIVLRAVVCIVLRAVCSKLDAAVGVILKAETKQKPASLRWVGGQASSGIFIGKEIWRRIEL